MNVPGDSELHWSLTLYVSGASSHSAAAIRTVRAICDGELTGQADLEIVDITRDPPVDMSHIYAIPTLVKRTPDPVRYLVGDLTDAARVREGLDLAPEAGERGEP